MKNSKKKDGNQMTDKFSKHHVLKIQLNGLLLEITSQNEQYSLVELDALLNIIAGNRNQLLAVSSSELPLNAQNQNEKNKGPLRSYIPSVDSLRFAQVHENLSSGSKEYRSEY